MEPDSDDWLDKYDISWLADAKFQTPNGSEYQSCSNADSTSKKHSPTSNVSRLSSRSQSPVYSLNPDEVTPRNAIESETPQDGNCDRSYPDVLHQPIAERSKDLGVTDSNNESDGIMDKSTSIPSGQLLEEKLSDEHKETGVNVTNNVDMPNEIKPACSVKRMPNYEEKDSKATFHCDSSTKNDTDNLMIMGTNQLESGLSSKTEDPGCEESGIDTTTYVDLAFAKNVPNVIMSPRSTIRKHYYVNKDNKNSTHYDPLTLEDTDFKSIKTRTGQFASALSMQGTPSNSDVPEITSGDLVELYLKYGMSKSETSILTDMSNKTSRENILASPSTSTCLDCSSTSGEKYPWIITKRYGVVDVNSDVLSLVPGLDRKQDAHMWRNGDNTVNGGDILLQANTEYPSFEHRYYTKELVSHSNSTEYFTTKSHNESSLSSTDDISHLNPKNVHNHETDSKPVEEYCEIRNTNLRKQPQPVFIYNARVPYSLIENESGYSSFLSLSSNETSTTQKTQFDPPPKDSRAHETATKQSLSSSVHDNQYEKYPRCKETTENNRSETEQVKFRVDISQNSNTEQANVADKRQSTSLITTNVPQIVDNIEHIIKSQHMSYTKSNSYKIQEVDKQLDKTVTPPDLTHTIPGDRHSYVKTLRGDIELNLDQLAMSSKMLGFKQKPESANVCTVYDPTKTIDERIEERFTTFSKKRITDIFPYNQGKAENEEEFEEQTKETMDSRRSNFEIFNQNTETATDIDKRSIINIYPYNQNTHCADIENSHPLSPTNMDDEVNTSHQDNDNVGQNQHTLNMHPDDSIVSENYQQTQSFSQSSKKSITDIYPFKQGQHDADDYLQQDPLAESLQQTYSEEAEAEFSMEEAHWAHNSQTGKFDNQQRDLEVSESPYHKEINQTDPQENNQDQATCLGNSSEKHITNIYPYNQYNDSKDDNADWLENDTASDTNQQMYQDEVSSLKSTEVDFMSCNGSNTLEMKDTINSNTAPQHEAVNVSDSEHSKQPVYHEEPIFSTNSEKHTYAINQDGYTDDRSLELDQTSDTLQQMYQDEQVRRSNSSNIHGVPLNYQTQQTPDVTDMDNSKVIIEQQQNSSTMQAGSSTSTIKDTHVINKPDTKARKLKDSTKAFSSEDSDLDVFDSNSGGFYMTHIKWKSSMNSAKVIKSRQRLRRVARNLLALAENTSVSDVEIVLFKRRKQKNQQRKSMKTKIAKRGSVESSKCNSKVYIADNNLNQDTDKICSSVITNTEGECDSQTPSTAKARQINSRESVPTPKSTCSSARKTTSQEVGNQPSKINWHNDAEASKLPGKESRHLKLATSVSNDYVNTYTNKESQISITTSRADANNISAIYKKFIDGSQSPEVHTTTSAGQDIRRTAQSTHTNIDNATRQKEYLSRNKSHNVIAYRVCDVKTPSQVAKPNLISEVNVVYDTMNYSRLTDSMRSKNNGMLTRRTEPCKQLSNPTENGCYDQPLTRNERSTELNSSSSEEGIKNRPSGGTKYRSHRVIPRTCELKEQAVDKDGLQPNTENTIKGSEKYNMINDGCTPVKQFQIRQPVVRYNGDWYQSKRPSDGETTPQPVNRTEDKGNACLNSLKKTHDEANFSNDNQKMKLENCMQNIAKDNGDSVSRRILPRSRSDGLKGSTVDGNKPTFVKKLTLPNTERTVKGHSKPDPKNVHVQNNVTYGGYIAGKESSSSNNKVKHTVVKMRPVNVRDTDKPNAKMTLDVAQKSVIPSGYLVDRGSQVMQSCNNERQKKRSVEGDSPYFLRSSTADINDKYQPVLVRSDNDFNEKLTPVAVNKRMVPKSMQAMKSSSKSYPEGTHDRVASNKANYGEYTASKQSQANQSSDIQRHVKFINNTTSTDKPEICTSKDNFSSGFYSGSLCQSSLKKDISKPGCTGRTTNTYEFPVERRLNAGQVSSKELTKALNEVIRDKALVKQQNSRKARFQVSKKGNRVRIFENPADDSTGLDFEFDYFTSKLKSKNGESKSTEDIVGHVNKFFSDNYIPTLGEVTQKAGLSHSDVHLFMHSKRKIRCALCKDEAVKDA